LYRDLPMAFLCPVTEISLYILQIKIYYRGIDNNVQHSESKNWYRCSEP
jgi:hypothetical protein